MLALSQLFKSVIILKVVMAISGLLMVGFLLTHMAGNLLIYKGPIAINHYAASLREYLPLLWAARAGLLLAVIVHIYSALVLTRINKKAKPKAYAVSHSLKASLLSRTMMLSGLIVLFFILYHLAHLTFRWFHPQFAALAEGDVYSMLVISFRQPALVVLYVGSIVLLSCHLAHGIRSLLQTLGVPYRKFESLITWATAVVCIVIAVGFISVPLAVFLGFIN